MTKELNKIEDELKEITKKIRQHAKDHRNIYRDFYKKKKKISNAEIHKAISESRKKAQKLWQEEEELLKHYLELTIKKLKK